MLIRLLALLLDVGLVIGVAAGVVLGIRAWNKSPKRKLDKRPHWNEWAASDPIIRAAIEIRAKLIAWVHQPNLKYISASEPQVIDDTNGIVEGLIRLAQTKRTLALIPGKEAEIRAIDAQMVETFQELDRTYQNITLATAPSPEATIDQIHAHRENLKIVVTAMEDTNRDLESA